MSKVGLYTLLLLKRYFVLYTCVYYIGKQIIFNELINTLFGHALFLKLRIDNLRRNMRYRTMWYCATSKPSDQPAHTHSLIRAFASRLSIL